MPMRDYVNVAIGKPVTATPGYTGYSAELAVDGIIHLPYVGYLSREQSNNFFEVDLQDEYAVYEVRFIQRISDATKLDGAIFTLKNGQGEQMKQFLQSDWGESLVDYVRSFSLPVTARYVRVDLPTGSMHLRELEVYAG
eukprot:Awhi_evm1s12090